MLRFTRYVRPVESPFITKYYLRIDNYGDLSKRHNFNKLLNDILFERPVQQWKLELNIDEFYHEIQPDFTHSNIVDKLLLKRVNLATPNSWGDKAPNYLGSVDTISKLFPYAKLIYIICDGRDVAI